MKNLDRLIKLMQFKTNNTFSFTETDDFIELEIDDRVFKQYIMKGDNVEKVKEDMFWYIIENLIGIYKIDNE
jgi:hypothetical protein